MQQGNKTLFDLFQNDAISVNSLPTLFFVIFVLLVLVISSTVYDVFTLLKKRENSSKILKAFSIHKNGKNLFNLNVKAENSIGCIHGIRSLSIFSIILVHTYFFRLASPYLDGNAFDELLQTKLASVISAGAICVDSFFVISGALITRSLLSDLDRNDLNLIKIYFQRFMRLTPCLAMMILINDFSITKQVQLGGGSDSAFLNYSVIPCRHYWWSAVFHMQNYVNPHEMCMHTTWYLSVDYQMFLIAPLFVYFLWKYNNKFLYCIYTLIMATCLYVFKVSLEEEFIVRDYDLTPEIDSAMFTRLYFPTHVRGAPFLVGIILGYHIYNHNPKLEKTALNNIVEKFYTVAAFIVFSNTFTIWATYEVLGQNVYLNAIFIAIARVTWAMAVSWIIFSCFRGDYKYLNAFLSWKYWMIFARMGLSIYLIHPVVQANIAIRQQEDISLEASEMLTFYLMETLITLFCAVIMYLTVEEPFSLIGKFITGKK